MDFPYVLIVWPPYLSCAKMCPSEIPLVFLNIGIEASFFFPQSDLLFCLSFNVSLLSKGANLSEVLKVASLLFWRGTIEVDIISSSDVGYW